MLAEQVDVIANELISDIDPQKLNKLSEIVGVKVFERAVLVSVVKDYLKKIVNIFELEDITVSSKEEIIDFLKDINNIAIANQIKIVQEQSKSLFQNPRFKLEFHNDYETGDKVLTLLIKSDGSPDEKLTSLHALDEYTEYKSNFIVDLDHS